MFQGEFIKPSTTFSTQMQSLTLRSSEVIIRLSSTSICRVSLTFSLTQALTPKITTLCTTWSKWATPLSFRPSAGARSLRTNCPLATCRVMKHWVRLPPTSLRGGLAGTKRPTAILSATWTSLRMPCTSTVAQCLSRTLKASSSRSRKAPWVSTRIPLKWSTWLKITSLSYLRIKARATFTVLLEKLQASNKAFKCWSIKINRAKVQASKAPSNKLTSRWVRTGTILFHLIVVWLK
jgi:hypothetical protein